MILLLTPAYLNVDLFLKIIAWHFGVSADCCFVQINAVQTLLQCAPDNMSKRYLLRASSFRRLSVQLLRNSNPQVTL
jgi:hypothetical protein